MEIGENDLSTGNILSGLGLVVGVLGLIAQLNAPHCPRCGTKLIVINNYCINCKVSWE